MYNVDCLEATRRRADNRYQGARPGRLHKAKFGPRTEPVFGPILGCEVSHFAMRRRARGVRSIRFLWAKNSVRILILDSETLTGTHSSFSRTSRNNNFGETLVECRDTRNNQQLHCLRNATQSKRSADLSDGSPRSQGIFLFPPPEDPPDQSHNANHPTETGQ